MSKKNKLNSYDDYVKYADFKIDDVVSESKAMTLSDIQNIYKNFTQQYGNISENSSVQYTVTTTTSGPAQGLVGGAVAGGLTGGDGTIDWQKQWVNSDFISTPVEPIYWTSTDTGTPIITNSDLQDYYNNPVQITALTDEEYELLQDIRSGKYNQQTVTEQLTITLHSEKKGRKFKELED